MKFLMFWNEGQSIKIHVYLKCRNYFKCIDVYAVNGSAELLSVMLLLGVSRLGTPVAMQVDSPGLGWVFSYSAFL